MKYSSMDRRAVVAFFMEKDAGNCYYCGEPLGVKFIVEHNHQTDEIRGLAHRSCNAKIAHQEPRIGGGIKIQVDLNTEEDKEVEIVKAENSLENKEAAVKQIISEAAARRAARKKG